VAAPLRAQEAEMYVLGIHPHAVVLLDGGKDAIVAEIQTTGRNPKEIVPSPDGKFLYVTSDGRAKLEMLNVQTRRVEKVFDITPADYHLTIFGVAVTSRGDLLYIHVRPVRMLPDELRVEPAQIWSVDVKSGQKKKIMEVPQGVMTLALTSDDRQLIAWGRDLYYIDPAQGRITDTYPLMSRTLPDKGPVNTLAAFVQYERSDILSLPYYTTDPITHKDSFGLADLDLVTGKLDLMELGPPVPLYSAVVSPDRKHAYALMLQLVAVDRTQRQVERMVDLERTRYVANISRDGKKLYVSGASPYIHVYDTTTLKLTKTIDLSGDPGVTAFRALPPVVR
jgi:DNA-binding beta-propeller fold protein YncE